MPIFSVLKALDFMVWSHDSLCKVKLIQFYK